MIITVPKQVETRLRRKAARTGQDADTLAGAMLSDALDDEATEEELRAEYHSLVDLEVTGRLSESQAARLRQIQDRLDDQDERNPAVQSLYRRLDQDADKLDRILAILENRARTP